MTAPGPVVCVGAHVQGLFMHVERVPREGESVLGWGYREPRDGGKVANVAVAASRFGAPAALVTVIGTDERSSGWLDYLASEGIDTRSVVRIDGPMDVGPALLPPSKVPAMVTVGDLSRRLDAALVAAHAERIRDASVVVCALESPADGVEAAFRIARHAGRTTVLNLSPVTEIRDQLVALVDVLVVNEDEASLITGHSARAADAAATISERWTVPTVVVTSGAAGASVVSDDVDALEVPAPAVKVVDTSGAGDALVGALAALLRDGVPLADAVPTAVAAASLSCTREHTMPSFATRPEVEAWAPEGTA